MFTNRHRAEILHRREERVRFECDSDSRLAPLIGGGSSVVGGRNGLQVSTSRRCLHASLGWLSDGDHAPLSLTADVSSPAPRDLVSDCARGAHKPFMQGLEHAQGLIIGFIPALFESLGSQSAYYRRLARAVSSGADGGDDRL